MEIKKILYGMLELIFLIGGLLYLILGILSLFNNHELIDKLGEKFSKNIRLEDSEIKPDEIQKKVKMKIAIELFISSIIDFILMVVCKFLNKSNNDIVNEDLSVSLIDMSKTKENDNYIN
jgi:hypothetical protein